MGFNLIFLVTIPYGWSQGMLFLTIQIIVVNTCTTKFKTSELFISPTQCIYVFCMILGFHHKICN